MDLSHSPCAPNVWLALKKYFTKRANALQFLSQGGLLLCGRDTPEEPKEQKEQLNGIAFINQCHIKHSVHRLKSLSTVYK